jgi:hypothetical protein
VREIFRGKLRLHIDGRRVPVGRLHGVVREFLSRALVARRLSLLLELALRLRALPGRIARKVAPYEANEARGTSLVL